MEPDLRGPLYDEVREAHRASAAGTGTRAISVGLLLDHRVRIERGRGYVDFVNLWREERKEKEKAESHDFLDAHRHFGKGEDPAIAGLGFDKHANRHNRITGKNKQQRLVHAINLSARFKQVSSGRDALNAEEEDIWLDSGTKALPSESEGWAEWLTAALEGDDSRKEKSLLAIFAALNAYRRPAPRRPTWVTPLRSYRGVLNGDPGDWLRALGMWFRKNSWVVLVIYPIARAAKLFRPTLLETDSELHFPSPRTAPLATGGHIMDVGHWRAQRPRQEYVHAPVALSIDDCRAPDLGIYCGKTTDALTETREIPPRLLSGWRSAHWTRLRHSYGVPVEEWMCEADV